MNDLLQATGYAALVYLLFNYLVSFGSGRPLVEWINPGRRYLPILAVTLAGGAYTTLLVATRKYQQSHTALLFKLISEEKAPPEVVGGLSFMIFGLSLLMLFFWCWWFLPRAPQTFNANPTDPLLEYRRALRHYVCWTGGLDFAIVCKIVGGQFRVVAEGADDVAIARGLTRLPTLPDSARNQRPADIEAQKQIYRTLAADLHGRWKILDDAVAAARHGSNVGISFDLRYGAVFAEVIEEPAAREGENGTGMFLFATALNQHQVTTLTAAKHFGLLCQAIRHIRSGVAKG